MVTIYPTLMAIDLLNVQREIERIDAHAAGYQLDIMDFQFVPNITYGPDFVHAVASITHKQLWLHLMVEDPLAWVDRFDLPTGTICTFHIETKTDHDLVIQEIRAHGWKPSIAVNPKTSLDSIKRHIEHIHQVLIMSVEPGFPGQRFLAATPKKIAALREYCVTNNENALRIGVDGGVGPANIANVVAAGADDLAVASAIFKAHNPLNALLALEQLAADASHKEQWMPQ